MEALYFPSLTLPESDWTNPNLLFFDHIEIIAPGARYGIGHLDYRTRHLIDHGLVQVWDPEKFARDEDDDEIVLIYMLAENQRRRSPRHISRIHIGKLAYSRLPEQLQRYGLLWRVEHHTDYEWLEGPRWVVDHLMTVIATRILAHRDRLSLITSSAEAKKIIVGTSVSRTRNKRRSDAAVRLLPVGADVDVRQIRRFKEIHRVELDQFRQVIDDLVRGNPDDEIFFARLNTAEQLRNKLVGELRQLDSRVPGIDIVLSAAALLAPVIEQSPYSAAVAAVGFGSLVYKLSQKRLQAREVRGRQMMYAALAQQRLMPSDWGGPVDY